MQDVLSGDSLTHVLCCVNPNPDNVRECFCTLQFGMRCLSIHTAPVVHAIPDGTSPGGSEAAHVAQLTAELNALRQELDSTHAHYQKLLERSGWLGSTRNVGPVERQAGTAASPAQWQPEQGFHNLLLQEAAPSESRGLSGERLLTATVCPEGSDADVKSKITDPSKAAARPALGRISTCQKSVRCGRHSAAGSECGYGASYGSLAALAQENKCDSLENGAGVTERHGCL
jgi:hypothetical protein